MVIDSEAEAPSISPWITAGIGLAGGLLLNFLLGGSAAFSSSAGVSASQAAGAGFVFTGCALLVFTLLPRRWWWSLAFSGGCALIAALIIWSRGGSQLWSDDDVWRMISAFLAVAVAAPLFQTMRDEEAARLPYPVVHAHAWANVVIWCAAFVFLAVTFLLGWLLASLFHLIGIDLLRHLMREAWFDYALAGTALGSAVGVLRTQDRIVPLLQRLVIVILRVLTPVLAAGLVLFLASLPFTGLAPLWAATSWTTPILLACVIGALILTNIAIGDSTEEETRLPLLRWSAIALSVAILPLAIIAAVSTGVRISEHGLTPERLWAVIFVACASAYGLGYLLSLLRARAEWMAEIRRANLRLVIGTAGLALLLALPILSFDAISSRNQIARLEGGKVTPEKFDWVALRFDFGEAGKRAFARLQRATDPRIRAAAQRNSAGKDRWALEAKRLQREQADRMRSHLRVLPAGATFPQSLRSVLVDSGNCVTGVCTVIMEEGGTAAVTISLPCALEKDGAGKNGRTRSEPAFPAGCIPQTSRLTLRDGKWQPQPDQNSRLDSKAARAALLDAYRAGAISIRPITKRQVYIGDIPVGEPLD